MLRPRSESNSKACKSAPRPTIKQVSAKTIEGEYDAIITDPPYYDAIPYSDLADFFYIWLRRTAWGLSDEIDAAFGAQLGVKWDHETRDGELIDDANRFNGDRGASKRNFEDGMAAVFRSCQSALRPNGILVIVFANKNPEAWETLVAAVIRAGFTVDGSLPIQTEMGNCTRAQSSAALSSSVWLVCRKRTATAQPGWSGPVSEQMRANITVQMRRFWDAGIRGPDFLWAATGPALEAFSRHPVVFREFASDGKREPMPVASFLREARRLVVEFAVGRVLKSNSDIDEGAAGLDDITTYYLLHRDSFGLNDAPVGACILYAISCGLSDQALIDQFEILGRIGGIAAAEADEDAVGNDEAEPDTSESEAEVSGTGSQVRLRRWDQRRRKTLGLEGVGGKPVPLIDRMHRLMQLWKAGDVTKVDAFINQAALGRDPMFSQLVQAVIELAGHEGHNDEAVMLQAISNHLHGRAGITPARQAELL